MCPSSVPTKSWDHLPEPGGTQENSTLSPAAVLAESLLKVQASLGARFPEASAAIPLGVKPPAIPWPIEGLAVVHREGVPGARPEEVICTDCTRIGAELPQLHCRKPRHQQPEA